MIDNIRINDGDVVDVYIDGNIFWVDVTVISLPSYTGGAGWIFLTKAKDRLIYVGELCTVIKQINK